MLLHDMVGRTFNEEPRPGDENQQDTDNEGRRYIRESGRNRAENLNAKIGSNPPQTAIASASKMTKIAFR